MLKSTGIVRKIDDLGRIVLPMEMRRVMNINEKDALEIFTDGERIVLQKYERGCSECGLVTEDLRGNAKICQECAAALAATPLL